MACVFRPFGRFVALFLAIFQFDTIATASSWAADASGWDGDQRSAARLIAQELHLEMSAIASGVLVLRLG